MHSKTPSVINIDKAHKKDFDALLNDRGSLFFHRENKDVFIMAMMYGLQHNKPKPLREKVPGAYFRVEYLTDQEKTLIKALAVQTAGSLDVLLDPKSVYSIAEEYAAGGIGYLKEDVFSGKFRAYERRLEELLLETVDGLSSGERDTATPERNR